MKKYYADKTGIGILFVALFILFAAIITLSAVYLSFLPILMWILIGVFSAVLLIVVIIWLPLYFKSLSYYVSNEEIVTNSGVFFKNKTVVKVSSIQYFVYMGTPFSNHTGINFLSLNVLGGNVFLMFLNKKDIDEIIKMISKHIFSKTEG